jgi:hypothetical protein
MYLRNFVRDYVGKYEFKVSLGELAERIELSADSMEFMDMDTFPYFQAYNGTANPGPSYGGVGAPRKAHVYELSKVVAKKKLRLLKEGRSPAPPLFCLAGRPKLAPADRMMAKKELGKASGRAVWMVDADEQFICGGFSIPLMRHFKTHVSGVLLGYNKHDNLSVEHLTSQLERFNVFVNPDFSEYDSTIPPCVIKRAFELIAFIFGTNMENGHGWGNVLKYISEYFTESLVVLENGEMVRTLSGNPSGTNLTSILNSLCHLVIQEEFISRYRHRWRREPFRGAYGDDGYYGLWHPSPDPVQRMIYARDVAQWLSDFVRDEFRMRIDADGCKIGAFLYVGIGVPRVPQDILKGCWDDIEQWFDMLQEYRGRPLRMEEKFRFLRTSEMRAITQGGEPVKWKYLFEQRAPFLQYYFAKECKMIRPVYELEQIALHPENDVKNLSEHRRLIISLLIENINNDEMVERFKEWLNDSIYMANMGITSWRDALNDYRFTIHREGFPNVRWDQLPLIRNKDTRFWYRRQKMRVNWTEDPRSDQFNDWWDQHIGDLEKIRNFIDPTDALYWQVRSAIRRSFKGLNWAGPGGVFSKKRFRGMYRALRRIMGPDLGDPRIIKYPEFKLEDDELDIIGEYLTQGYHIRGYAEGLECDKMRKRVDVILTRCRLEDRGGYLEKPLPKSLRI